MNLYENPTSPKNQFTLTGNKYDGRDVWFNGDKVYLFQKMGIWFLSQTIGALSGFAYSRDGHHCPTEFR